MTKTQKIALAELNIALDRLSERVDKWEKGYFQGPYDYATRDEAERVHGSMTWVWDGQKTYSGLRSHFNHPNRCRAHRSGHHRPFVRRSI